MWSLTAAILFAGLLGCVLGWFRTYQRLMNIRRDQETQERSSRFIEEERRVLELVAKGASVKQVLDALTAAVERMAPNCFCSVLLLDEEGRLLREGSGGSLPRGYMEMVDGLPIGPDVGSCGSAAFRNQTVIVQDISTDYRWTAAKALPLGFGLHACWSVPIRDSNGGVLGTFAMYHQKPASPHPRDLAVVEAGAHLAGNAIERLTAERKLKENAGAPANRRRGSRIWSVGTGRGHRYVDALQGAATLSGLPRSRLARSRGRNEKTDPPR